MALQNVKLTGLRAYSAYISTHGRISVSPGQELTVPVNVDPKIPDVAVMLIHDRVARFDSVVIPPPGADGRPKITEAEVALIERKMKAAHDTADRLTRTS